jgi:hypothetical protein
LLNDISEVANMAKDYTIKGTTKLQREKIVGDAISLSTLDAPKPSEMAMELMREYVDGKCELEEARQRIIERYRAFTSSLLTTSAN